MFRMSRHPDGTAISFQEKYALRHLQKFGNLTTVASCVSCNFAVDAALLDQCLHIVCANHAAFTTRFIEDDSGGFRRHFIALDKPFTYAETEAGDTPDDPEVGDAIRAFCSRPFLGKDQHWLRVMTIRTRRGDSVLVFRVPHVIHDAASVRIMLSEIWEHYATLSRGETVTATPGRFTLQDYAASQHDWVTRDNFESQLGALVERTRSRLVRLQAGMPDRDASASRPGTFVLTTLPDVVQAQLQDLATRIGSSLHSVLMAAATVLLGRQSKRRELCFRTPFSGRIAGGTARIIGFLATDLPLFVSLRNEDNFIQLVQDVQRESMDVMRYGPIPWHLMADRLQDREATALFDDFLINVIPAAERFGTGDAMEVKSFPLPVIGRTNSILKMLIYVRDRGTTITLVAGENETAWLEEFLMPECLRVIAQLAREPEMPLRDVLAGSELAPCPTDLPGDADSQMVLGDNSPAGTTTIPS